MWLSLKILEAHFIFSVWVAPCLCKWIIQITPPGLALVNSPRIRSWPKVLALSLSIIMLFGGRTFWLVPLSPSSLASHLHSASQLDNGGG